MIHNQRNAVPAATPTDSNGQRWRRPNNHRPAQHRLSAYFLRRLFRDLGSPPVAFVLWDGAVIAPGDDEPIAKIHIRRSSALWKLCLNPMVAFGESFSQGDIDVEEDFAQLMKIVFAAYKPHGGRPAGCDQKACCQPNLNTPVDSLRNIHHHYDIGNDFYRLWLDKQMLYSCAFADSAMSLERAQVAKMEHVCRKLQLKRGDVVLDAGSGWGGLSIYMARRYGVRVKAFNISRDQVRYARRWAAREQLSGQIEFIEDDWRNMSDPCDVFVSLGMLEHVGVANYSLLGDVIHRCLKPKGRGLLHFIGQNYSHPINPWIERRIFPGAYPPALSEAMRVFEPHNFSVLDVENLRLHYARTLRCWRERFEHATETVSEMFDEQFVRMWRLYLCGSIAAFESGSLQLFQMLFARGDNNDIPMTRSEVYAVPYA